jgi:Zn finger protein HypA/HybF involved in hydrogenase expression
VAGVKVTALARTLDQELLALFRGASLECLACGEFVLHEAHAVTCPECGSHLPRTAGTAAGGEQLSLGARTG